MKFFKKLFGKKKKEETRSDISAPWAQNVSSRTMAGQQFNNTTKQSNPNPICPQCGYPLLAEPSPATPCPSCEFKGFQQSAPQYNGPKTMNLSSLIEDEKRMVSGLNFVLVDESNNEKIKIECEETEVILTREHLDPDNSSISGTAHAMFRFYQGEILVADVSSNKATFIQVKEKTPIYQNCRIILGNKIMMLNVGSAPVIPPSSSGPGKTQNLGQFNMQQFQGGMANHVELLDERTGQTNKFLESPVVLNRSSLDPMNNSISGSQHAVIENINGLWHITDFSSNKATFIQLISESKLTHKTKLVFGNKIFRFELD